MRPRPRTGCIPGRKPLPTFSAASAQCCAGSGSTPQVPPVSTFSPHLPCRACTAECSGSSGQHKPTCEDPPGHPASSARFADCRIWTMSGTSPVCRLGNNPAGAVHPVLFVRVPADGNAHQSVGRFLPTALKVLAKTRRRPYLARSHATSGRCPRMLLPKTITSCAGGQPASCPSRLAPGQRSCMNDCPGEVVFAPATWRQVRAQAASRIRIILVPAVD